MSNLRKWRIILLAELAVMLIVFIVTAYDIVDYGKQNIDCHSDAIVVLGSAVINNQPSPIFRERINHAYDLYKGGKSGKIILTGGKSTSNEISEAKAAKNYLVSLGVSESDLLVEDRSKTTWQNLIYTKELMQSNDIYTITLVSDPYHMKRAMMMAKMMNLNACSSPTDTSAVKSLVKRSHFLIRETYLYLQHQFVEI